jgi:uncharacterized membrane protein
VCGTAPSLDGLLSDTESDACEGRTMDATYTSGRNGGGYGMVLGAAAAGATAMYLLDPNGGRRRRARLRDQAAKLAHVAQDFSGKVERDAVQRARGLYLGQTARFRDEQPDDRVLAERVRAALGRLTSHPGPIYVVAQDGVVRLRGDVLRRDAGAVVRGVRHVRGVRDVLDELRVHDHPGRISSLQGDWTSRTKRLEYLQSNWSPAPRVLAGGAGLALAIGGLALRSGAGYGLAAAGAALLTRAIANRPLSHLIGARTDESDGVRVQKTIEVYAETDEVYACWRDLECFPRFMQHIREVEQVDDTHYRWSVDGPAGMPVTFDAEITADVPGEMIAWRTINSKMVHSSGVVHFEPTPTGGTRVHVHMTYWPLANRVGHTVAKMFARDPKTQMSDDLARFKSYVELGGPTSGATLAHTPAELTPIQH